MTNLGRSMNSEQMRKSSFDVVFSPWPEEGCGLLMVGLLNLGFASDSPEKSSPVFSSRLSHFHLADCFLIIVMITGTAHRRTGSRSLQEYQSEKESRESIVMFRSQKMKSSGSRLFTPVRLMRALTVGASLYRSLSSAWSNRAP